MGQGADFSLEERHLLHKIDGKAERMCALAIEICEFDDQKLGDFPCCDFYFPYQIGGKGTC